MGEGSIPLRQYVEERFRLNDEARNLALLQMERRLESMNEFRNQLKDQTATFINKTEHQILIDNFQRQMGDIQKDIRDLREARAQMEGKASQSSVNKAMILAIVSLLVAAAELAVFIFKK